MTDRMHIREGWNPPVMPEGIIWLRDTETGEDVDLQVFESDAYARGAVANFETLAASDCECAASWFPGAFAPCDGPHGIQACDGCTAHGDDFDTAYAIAAHLQGLTGRTYSVWYEAEPVIFASKPQRVDRFPFVSVLADGSEARRFATAGEAQAMESRTNGALRWDCRPREFAAQSHEPNPILTWHRAATREGMHAITARYALDHWAATVGNLPDLGIATYTAAHEHHARRVLSRLARLAVPA